MTFGGVMSKHVVTNEYQYKAFISYSHKDDRFSSWLLRALEAYRLPAHVRKKIDAPTKLGRIFRDRDELPATGHMTDRIFEALEASEYLIVVCSPASAKSKLVNREIAEFKRIRGDSNILCIIIDGKPFASNPDDECFPETLKLKFTEEGKQSGFAAEGLAADAREEGDGERQALLKLIAGMLNVGLNDLVRRENQRRQRKLMAFAIAASVGMAAMGGLAYEARNARLEAESSLKLAKIKEAEAETHLRDVEDISRFVMNSIFDELLASSNLHLLESIAAQITAYLESKDINRIGAIQATQLVASRLRLGQAIERKGESERARVIFDKTLDLARRFYSQHPDNGTVLARLETTLFFTGYLARRQGDYERALKDGLERHTLNLDGLERGLVVAVNGTPVEGSVWEEEIADSELMLCWLQSGPLDQAETALENCKQSVARRVKLSILDTSDAMAVSLASSYYQLGRTHQMLGHIEEARKAYEARLALYGDILDRTKLNYRIERRYAMTLQLLAALDLDLGNHDEALTKLKSARATFDKLTEQDDANVMWLADSANLYHDYAALLFKMGNIEEAASALTTAEQQISAALAADNSRISRRLTAHQIQLLAARLTAARGDAEGAAERASLARTALESEGQNFLRAHKVLDYAGELYLFYGDQLNATGKHDAAQESWQKLAQLNETTVATKTPVFLKTLETSLARLETPAEVAR